MQKKFPGKRKAIALGVILASFSVPVAAQDDVEIEEVIVTGSFIRGTPLDAPSPVQIVDRSSIEAQGAAIIWDVIKNLEINSGSFTNSGSGERSQVEGTAQVNLRNLGENSTLVLINGKRVSPYAGTTTTGGEFVDINAIPLVMTERIEILTDGGSALYGADAGAGAASGQARHHRRRARPGRLSRHRTGREQAEPRPAAGRRSRPAQAGDDRPRAIAVRGRQPHSCGAAVHHQP